MAALTGLSGCLGNIGGGGELPSIALGWVVPVENIGSMLDIPAIQEELPNLGEAYEFESVQHSSTPEGVSSLAAGETQATLVTTLSYSNVIEENAVPGGVTAVITDFWDAYPDHFGFRTFSHGDSDITEPADLEGNQLGVNATGTGIHAILVKQIVELGLDPDEDVEFVEFGFPAFIEAINTGQFDAGIFPALFALQAAAEGFNLVFTSHDVFDPYPFAYTVVRNSAIEEEEEAVRAFVEDYIYVWEWMQDNQSDAVSLGAEHFGLPEEGLDAMMFSENDYYRGDLSMDIEALNGIMQEMEDLGFIDQALDYSDHATNEFRP